MSQVKSSIQAVKDVKTTPREVAGVLNTVAIILLIWMALVAFAPLFIDGNVYHIESPAPVEVHNGGTIRIEITRYAAVDMAGTCSLELECNEVIYELGAESCPIERGTDTFIRTVPVPLTIQDHVAKGHVFTCQIRGLVEYAPLKYFGPQLQHPWYTEEFVIE